MSAEKLDKLIAAGPGGLAPELFAILLAERDRRLRHQGPPPLANLLSGSYREPSTSNDPWALPEVDWLLVLGASFLVVGLVWLVAALNMDVSVSTGLWGDRVVNLGLMSRRQAHLIVAGVITLLGGVLLGFGLSRRR
jgi:hypothetical protein